MAITAEEHRKLHIQRRLREMRVRIRSQPPYIKAQVKMGEYTIDVALSGHDQAWFDGDAYLKVFDRNEQIDPEARKLLTRLYEIIGFNIRWGDPASQDVNSVRMEYRRDV